MFPHAGNWTWFFVLCPQYNTMLYNWCTFCRQSRCKYSPMLPLSCLCGDAWLILCALNEFNWIELHWFKIYTPRVACGGFGAIVVPAFCAQPYWEPRVSFKVGVDESVHELWPLQRLNTESETESYQKRGSSLGLPGSRPPPTLLHPVDWFWVDWSQH